jgi:DNA polymerase-1
MRTLVIDGDTLVHQATEQCQYETWWDETENMRTAVCNVAGAAAEIATRINALGRAANANMVTVAIGPDTKANFRNILWPEYKMHRRRADSPVGLRAVRDRIRADFGAAIITALPHEEADDVMGYHMTRPSVDEKILWSPDKDMLQIPGWHFDEERGEFKVSPLEADLMHMMQTLTGDTSDGYPGCHGIGKVTAAKILDPTNRDSWWPAVVKTYIKAGFDEKFALTQARVARILRFGEEPMQWTPTT